MNNKMLFTFIKQTVQTLLWDFLSSKSILQLKVAEISIIDYDNSRAFAGKCND